MTLELFNSKYKYKSDLEKYGTSRFDIWEIPEIEDDIYYGDCESYCRFLKENIEEFKEWDYYYCKLNGVGHCILVNKGKVIDCNIQKVVSLYYYESVYKVSDLKKYNCLTILFKILFSMVYVPFNKLIKRI